MKTSKDKQRQKQTKKRRKEKKKNPFNTLFYFLSTFTEIILPNTNMWIREPAKLMTKFTTKQIKTSRNSTKQHLEDQKKEKKIINNRPTSDLREHMASDIFPLSFQNDVTEQPILLG